MSSFQADFGNTNWILAPVTDALLLFVNTSDPSFSLTNGSWAPAADAPVVLSCTLGFTADTPTTVTLALLKNSRTVLMATTGTSFGIGLVKFSAQDFATAVQATDESDNPLFDDDNNPIYVSAASDNYQLHITTANEITILGDPGISRFSGTTVTIAADSQISWPDRPSPNGPIPVY